MYSLSTAAYAAVVFMRIKFVIFGKTSFGRTAQRMKFTVRVFIDKKRIPHEHLKNYVIANDAVDRIINALNAGAELKNTGK